MTIEINLQELGASFFTANLKQMELEKLFENLM
jgi:hypothetical protein